MGLSLLNNPTNPAVMQNDLHAKTNAKAEVSKSSIPSEEEIKSKLDTFVKEEHEKASLAAIQNADHILKNANSENKLDDTLREFKEFHEKISNLLFSNLDTSSDRKT
ncbi:hypothetical protein F0310_05565, partial (plasmid) [Borrelia sp. A-FGy1]